MKTKKPIKKRYYCRHCGTEADIPIIQDGIRLEDVKRIECPKCLAKKKRYKMYEVIS